MSEYVMLKPSDAFDAGLHRKCYRHPLDPHKCIKIVIHGNQQETRRELAYYQLLSKRQISWGHLAKYYGQVQTNLGDGSVFELIVDDDSSVSKTMRYYLTQPSSMHDLHNLITSMQQLYTYMLDNKIVTMTMKAKNICWQKMKGGGERLVIVDNIGNSDYIPICNYVDYFAVQKIRRRWQRFLKRIVRACPPALRKQFMHALHTKFSAYDLCKNPWMR